MWKVVRSAVRDIDDLLSRFATADVYHRSTFHEYDSRNGYGEPCVYLYEDERGALLHPFMLRPIERVGDRDLSRTLYDIESVKGLSGPLSSRSEQAFLTEAWRHYDAWCRANDVVAEYVRFNPFVDNEKLAAGFFDVEHHARIGVVVDLTPSEQEIWNAQYNVNQRNMVRKAEQLGIECVLDTSAEGFDEFVELQAKAWERLNARQDRHYPRESLYFLKRKFGEAAPLFSCKREGRLIVAALFLVGSQVIHYQFSARAAGASDVGANNLLLHAAAVWARGQGLETLHLGAGRTADPKDELFRFKRCLSPKRVSYARGFRCYAPDAFRDLCALWQRQAPGAQMPAHSMPYREPLPERVANSELAN
jgi:hypothetical protein